MADDTTLTLPLGGHEDAAADGIEGTAGRSLPTEPELHDIGPDGTELLDAGPNDGPAEFAAGREPSPLLHERGLLDTVSCGDPLQLLAGVPDASVDLVLSALPYGTRGHAAQSDIELTSLWQALRRVLTDRGVVLLFATQPFASSLVVSNPDWFRYEWVWRKTIASGQLNVRHQPLRAHESILVFYGRKPTYRPQLRNGTPYVAQRDMSGGGYGQQRAHTSVNEGVRWPNSVLEFANPRQAGSHRGAKPVDLLGYLIRTYTDPGAVVLDVSCEDEALVSAAWTEGRHAVALTPSQDSAAAANEHLKGVRADLDSRLPL